MVYKHTTRKRKRKSILGGHSVNVLPIPNIQNKTHILEYVKQAKSRSVPTLKQLKSTLSNHDYQYLEDTLRKISLGDLHKAYSDKTLKSSYLFYKLDQIITLLTTEINNITANSSSGGYAFTTDAAPRIIQELQRYIQYFKNVTYDFGRIDLKFHEALFE
jgi:hypothetical protein